MSEPTPSAPKRTSRRARIDTAPVDRPEEGAGDAAPPPATASTRGRDRVAAAVAAVAAVRAGAKPELGVDLMDEAPPPPVRPRRADAAPKPVWIERSPRPRRLSYVVQAATIAVAVGLGWAAGSRGPSPRPAATPESVQALAEEVLRLQGDLRSLKGGVEAVRDGVEHQRQEANARLQQWGERLAAHTAAQPAAADATVAPRLDALAQRLDRLESPDRDGAQRLAQVTERLDRAERQIAARAAAPAAPPAPPTPAAAPMPEQTGSVTEAKPTPKPTLDRWALRDVYNGVALVEGQNGGVVEVGPGQTIPGVGRVEAIERRGKAWVVVTSRGLIAPQPW